MAHDVFISYSSSDKAVADGVVAGLEQKGIRCWVAPRDLTPGISWGQGIAEAIESSKVMVVILSENSNQSRQVAREVERAVSKEVAVIPFRIENIDPTGAIAYFLSSEHWLDAISPPLERHIVKLGNVINLFLKENGDEPVSDSIVTHPPEMALPPEEQKSSFWSKNSTITIAIGAAAVGILCLAAILIGALVILPKLRATPTPEVAQVEQELPLEAQEESTPTETSMTFDANDTPAPTLEPTPEPTSTSESFLSLPANWVEHISTDFVIGLPQGWEVVDIDQEGMDAMMDLLSEFDPTWADTIESTYASESVVPPLFFAMDTQMYGLGYANISVNKETLPIPIPIRDICTELDLAYGQMGMDILESDCNLTINGKPAARYMIGMTMGSITTQQYQYLYMNSRDFWIINFSVDQSGWSQYQSVFIEIADSFTILN